MSVRISRGLLATLLAEAAGAADREVCGLLLGEAVAPPGRGGAAERIAQVIPTTNVAAKPADRFEIDPAALFAAIRGARIGGPRILGHYHSHPNGLTTPSPRDAAMADTPGRLWLIVAHGQARLWREQPGGPVQAAFDSVRLVVDEGKGSCA